MGDAQRIVNLIDSAETSNAISISYLVSQCDLKKLEAIVTKLNSLIHTSRGEGNFTLVVSNDLLEELFGEVEEEAFNEYLLKAVVEIYKRRGYTVKYEDLMYSDMGNIMEILW